MREGGRGQATVGFAISKGKQQLKLGLRKGSQQNGARTIDRVKGDLKKQGKGFLGNKGRFVRREKNEEAGDSPAKVNKQGLRLSLRGPSRNTI